MTFSVSALTIFSHMAVLSISFKSKQQKVQNNAARAFPQEFPKLTISSVASLNWLPIDSCIQCKFTSLCCNCLNDNATALGYLTELLKVYKPTQQLGSSSDTSILYLFSVHMHSLGQRSFSAPSVCDGLSCKVRSTSTLTSFSFQISPLKLSH